MTFDRTAALQLVLVELDSLFRMGLQRYLRQYTDWQVVAETDNFEQVLGLLQQQAQTAGLPDILILGWPPHMGLPADSATGLALCRQVKAAYPYLRVLILSDLADPGLAEAWWLGIEGCCWRSGAETELLEAIWQVANGQTYWNPQMKASALGEPIPAALAPVSPQGRRPAWRQIDASLAAIEQQLQSPSLSLIERLILQGQRRELRASRWLVQQILPSAKSQPVLPPAAVAPQLPGSAGPSPAGGGLQLANIFDRLVDRLRFPLENPTETPLEIDILRADKKRELLYIVLRQFEKLLDEVRFSRVPVNQLPERRSPLLIDLWQACLTEFFGKYLSLPTGGQFSDRSVEVLPLLQEQQYRVEREIFDSIPLVPELMAHLLYQTPLTIDNEQFPASSPVAQQQALAMLENLLIQMANAVIQPLLNQFADDEAIKQTFYDRRRLSTREIERFRNNLSWHYRMERYVNEPTAIFGSQFRLWGLSEAGLVQRSIYAPRRAELDKLTGVPLAVTLLLEARDAVSPRLKSATAWLGSGLVYVLTEVVGRGIGLVGRGIIKGIGNALQERR